MAATDNRNVSQTFRLNVVNSDRNPTLDRTNGGKNHTTFETVRTLKQDVDYVRFRRKSQSNSKNALLARENRIRKKIYVQNLEDQLQTTKNKLRALSKKLDTQNSMIVDLNRELAYYKNVLSNSEEICTLIKTLKRTTGLPSTSSLKCKERNVFSSPYRAHDFDADSNGSPVLSDTNFDFDISSSFSPFIDTDNEHPVLSDVSLFPNNYDIPLSPIRKKNSLVEPNAHDEHNYTLKGPNSYDDDDTGICLHISNKKLSLEFCARCHDNFNRAWAPEENE